MKHIDFWKAAGGVVHGARSLPLGMHRFRSKGRNSRTGQTRQIYLE